MRCYLPPESWGQARVKVSGKEAHHLIHVRRVKQGEVVGCFDGQGQEALGIVEQLGRDEVSLRLKKRKLLPEPPWRIVLGVALPRHGRLDQIIDQATQLGVSQIVPLTTARGIVRIPAERLSKKQIRWTQIAIEAGKQSGSSRVPSVCPPVLWSSFVSSIQGAYDLALIATPQGSHEELKSLLCDRNPRRILLLIGPEGDFTPDEVDEALRAGAHRISLGPLVLRCETAAVVAVGLVNFLMRERAG